MPFNGSGTFNLPYNWQNDAAQGLNISSARMQGQDADIAGGLSNCLTKDGQQTPVANLPMGGFRLTNLGNANAQGNATTVQDVQNGSVVTLTSVAGTDTITANATPVISAYAAGQCFDFIAAGANLTGTVTLNVSALGAKNVTKWGGGALIPGDILAGQSVRVRYDGTEFQIISDTLPGKVLLSSQTVSSAVASVNFSNLFSSLFTDYEIEIIDAQGSSASSHSLYARVSQSGTFATAAYSYGWQFVNTANASFGGGSASQAFIELLNGQVNGSGLGQSGTFRLYNPLGTTSVKRCTWDIAAVNGAGAIAAYRGGGFMGSNLNALDGIQFLYSAGNVVQGTFKLYGIRA